MDGTESYSWIKDLSQAAYQLGPFLFSLLFVFYAVNRTHAHLNDVMSNDQANATVVRFYKWIHGGAWAVGIGLVVVSTAWWWLMQPQRNVYQFSILDIQPHEQVYSQEFYFRVAEHKAPFEGAPTQRDLHFVVVRDRPMEDGEELEIYYFKNAVVKPRLLKIPVSSHQHPRYRIEFQDNGTADGIYMVKPIAADWRLVGTAFAMEPAPAVPPPVGGFPNVQQELNLRRLNEPLARPLPAAPSSGPGGLCTDTVFGTVIICVPANTAPALDLRERVQVLQVERASVPSKIAALDALLTAPDAERGPVIDGWRGEPLILTLLDLTRHNDRELAAKTQRFLATLDVSGALADALRKAPDDASRQLLLARVDRTLATDVLKRVQADGTGEKLEIPDAPLLLVPTASPEGDRYYVKASWTPGNEGVRSCLTVLFNRRLISQRSLADEAALMKGRSNRVAYWYSKSWALDMARDIRACGAKAEFIGLQGG